MHPQSSIQQSPGPTSVKASAAAASPLALHPPLPPLHTLSRCPASWAGTNSPQSPQSKGGWARVVVWGGQPQQAGRALRLPSGRAPRLRAAAAPPQGSGGPAEDPQPPSASPGSLLPSRPSPRPAGRALPPKRRVNAAAIPSRHRSPLTSLQTSPLRQGLPLPPPPQSPWKPAPSSCRLRPRSPAASPGKAVASSNGCATCPQAAIFYPARGSGVAAGDGPAWPSAREERAAWRAPRLQWGRSDWDKQGCWACPYLVLDGPSLPAPAQQQATRSPWQRREGGVFTSRHFSPLCGRPGASPEN